LGILGVMPIPANEAADIAAEHGLGLADAQALSTLADDKEHAGKLAARFKPAEDEASAAKAIADRVDGGGF
jgi:hypothetical protein